MRNLLFLFLIMLLCNALWAQQSRKELESQKKKTLKEIIEAEQILAETESEKFVSLGQLRALNQQLKSRQSLIKAIDGEIKILNTEIQETNIIIESLEQDLNNLKKEYASMVYVAHKANEGFNRLTFIFSAETFHQFFMRLKYMDQYSKARKNQVAEITKVKSMLETQIASIKEKTKKKEQLRAQQVKENKNLLALKSKQSNLVQQLSKKEKELKQELADKKDAVEKLDKLIADLVAREMELAKKESESSRANIDFNYASSSFEDNKSKLVWPVSKGFVSGKFGVHPHPVLKGILEKNDGINIQTNKQEKVYAVFNGKVTKVAIAPPPFHNVILIQHGEYFTVYSKLRKVYVKTGQTVKAKDLLGEVHTDKDGVSELHFMVWKNNQKLDPENWLVKN